MKAIAYFSNGIGNLVMMMPALQALSERTANKIDVVLNSEWSDSRRPAVEEILRAWDVVDRVIEHPRENFDPRAYDLWFYSPHGASSVASTVFTSQRKTRPVPRPNWRESFEHEVDHYMEIARSLGYEGPAPQVQFPRAPSPILNGEFRRPLIGLCNGYFRTSYWAKKGWPYFAGLSNVLKRLFGAGVVAVGAAGEVPSSARLDGDFGGVLSITQTARLLSQLDLLVTTDTGNMHIADSMGVPLVALFGSTLTSKNAPRAKTSTVLSAGASCAPCQDTGRFYRCAKAACMESITVGDVVAAIKEKMRWD
jgi:ADP-heptose:LPS heptosyltransferase